MLTSCNTYEVEHEQFNKLKAAMLQRAEKLSAHWVITAKKTHRIMEIKVN